MQLECGADTALFGRCGGGRDKDCKDTMGEYFCHGIYCCRVAMN